MRKAQEEEDTMTSTRKACFTGGNTMRYAICILCMMFFSVTSATAQVSVGIGLPGLSIGINMPVYPAFVRVPNYPVYYAPGASSNYF
ncbi:MAG: hypothetical protein WCA24_00015, partial [Thiomonas sp.]